jgi:phosphopantothenoylcysteine decarboxylase/phosphopantothenate--cysteine ligase
VRYLGNRSSGKQGHAIAESLAAAGVNVTLVTGRTELPDPANVNTIHVTTTEDMLRAVEAALPADIFVGAAAVADWRMTHVATQKIKKHDAHTKLTLELVPTADILKTVSTHKKRPALVIGFAAETDQLEKTATAKRKAKGCDWLLANHVAQGAVFGAEDNEVLFVDGKVHEHWKRMHKRAVADQLTARIATFFSQKSVKKGKAS